MRTEFFTLRKKNIFDIKNLIINNTVLYVDYYLDLDPIPLDPTHKHVGCGVFSDPKFHGTQIQISDPDPLKFR